MAHRGRSRRAVRTDHAPEPAEEAGQQAGEAPQVVESLLRLNREYHIAGALELFLPYACFGAADAVDGRGRFRARNPAAGLRLRRSTPVSICGALEARDAYVLPPVG
ncbi:hypothetical protein PIB30_008879 [Stylosanthes scabra]|uniref:Uncharacterized protein n=1 Tax=Stylosanthes scabra TaxID=79078 RepID=A0ABU6Z2X5_9FABA|nr:hypothetical protein [Stylosanthes scabra]